MKEVDERILRNKIFLAEKNRPGEFAIIDVAADRGDVLMEEFGNLPGGVEIELGAHCSPMSFLIL